MRATASRSNSGPRSGCRETAGAANPDRAPYAEAVRQVGERLDNGYLAIGPAADRHDPGKDIVSAKLNARGVAQLRQQFFAHAKSSTTAARANEGWRAMSFENP